MPEIPDYNIDPNRQYAVPGKLLEELLTEVRRLGKITAYGAVQLTNDSGGITIGVKQTTATPVYVAQITGTADVIAVSGSGSGLTVGGSGYTPGQSLPQSAYTGYLCTLSPNGTNPFALPTYRANPNAEVYLVNMAEPRGASGHTLTIGSYCWALPTGATATDGGAVYTIIQMEDPPTNMYQVKTPIDATLKPIWTSVRFTSDSGVPASGSGSGS